MLPPRSIALGCMNFGKRTPKNESLAILDRAIERGVTVLDTANAYNDGESERIAGEAIRRAKKPLIVATKVGFARVSGKPEGLGRAHVLRACDESKKRLGVDVIDLYYLHVPDHQTPIEETLDAIGELLAKGHIRAWGVSNYAAWQILEMIHIADARNLPRPVASQVLHNLLIRQVEIEHAAFARKYGVHVTVFNALAGGLLTGRHARSGETQKGSRFDKNQLYLTRYWSDRFFDLVDAYAAVAGEAGIGLVEMAYAWLAGHPSVDSVLVGPATMAQLDAAIEGTARALPDSVRARIDEIHFAAAGTRSSYVR